MLKNDLNKATKAIITELKDGAEPLAVPITHIEGANAFEVH